MVERIYELAHKCLVPKRLGAYSPVLKHQRLVEYCVLILSSVISVKCATCLINILAIPRSSCNLTTWKLCTNTKVMQYGHEVGSQYNASSSQLKTKPEGSKLQGIKFSFVIQCICLVIFLVFPDLVCLLSVWGKAPTSLSVASSCALAENDSTPAHSGTHTGQCPPASHCPTRVCEEPRAYLQKRFTDNNVLWLSNWKDWVNSVKCKLGRD